MRLLQRAILYELLRVFGFLLGVLTVLLVFVGVLEQAAEKGLGPEQIAQILPYVVPSLMPFTIPATLLLSVCVVYGRMGGDQEVVAAKAAGAHVFNLLTPAFLLAAALAVTSFALTDRVIPWAMGNIQRIVTSAVEDLFLDYLRTSNHFTDPQKGLTIVARGVDGRTLIEPQFRYAPPGRDPVLLVARSADIRFDLDAGRVRVDLRHAQMTAGDARADFDRLEHDFPLDLGGGDDKPRHQTTEQLEAWLVEIAENAAARELHAARLAALDLTLGELPLQFRTAPDPPAPERSKLWEDKIRTEIYSRPAMAASCLFFALIGGPFAIKMGRSSFLTTFLICFVPILVVYYPVTLGMLNLSKHGDADPRWAVWVGNALVGTWGLLTLRQVARF